MKATFEEAWKELPDGVDDDPMRFKTLRDLQWAVRIQLDLIEEGQDGTEDDDPKPLRKWLDKFGDPTKSQVH